jgi:hypothetical protein
MERKQVMKETEVETIDTKAMNIYEKIQAVSNEVRNVEKNLVVGTGNSAYKAVGDLDVVMKVKEAETKFRVVSIPVRQELVKSEIVRVVGNNGYEKLTYSDIVKMTVKIVNLDNTSETLEVESFGRGLDAGDKGFGKASTYARKYALLNAYKIATGEDPDANKSEQQVALTKDEVKDKVLNYLMQNANYCNSCLSYYGCKTVEELDSKAINSIYKNLKGKGIEL